MLGTADELTRGRLLVRNVALNVAGWAFPAVGALLAIPLLVRTMGPDRFGLLALVWTLVGAFSPFDLGIGRALTQALASRVGRADQNDSPDVAWTAGWLLLGVGVCGGLALAGVASALADRWLNLPPELRVEATRGLRLLAVAVPLTTVTAGLRGVLEAGQAFRAVNALRLPLALSMFGGPLLVQPWTRSLPAAVGALVVARVLVVALHVAAVARLYPALARVRPPRLHALRSLRGVAGWMTVSTLSHPLLATGDRLLIGAALPMTAFAQYAAVSELASKLSVIGGVLQPVLFPALAATLAADRRRAAALFDRGARATALAAAPAALALVAFAPEVLSVWLGGVLARDATPVLQILAVGWYVNACAQLPYAALQGAGRADLPAKFHAVQVPLHLGTLWLLVDQFGLVGAAVAGALRMLVDAAALYAAVPRVLPGAGRFVGRAAGAALGGAAAALGVCAVAGPLSVRAAAAAAGFTACAVGAHRWLVSTDERAMARAWLVRTVRSRRAAAPAVADGT